jgi:acetylornithine/N-succinyldiaminopimelate aminotransferase
MFAIDGLDIKVDFMTMAKGIGGGFPIGAFAVSQEIADKIEVGDHGGTYCGNPLGAAVAYAVIKYLKDNDIAGHVLKMGQLIMERLGQLQKRFKDSIPDVRGKGLLIAVEFRNDMVASSVLSECLKKKMFANVTQGNIIRLFPALTITAEEIHEAMGIFESAVEAIAGEKQDI